MVKTAQDYAPLFRALPQATLLSRDLKFEILQPCQNSGELGCSTTIIVGIPPGESRMTGTADSFVAALVASGWPWRRLQSGSLYIDVAAPDPPPAVGETMNLVLIAFLQEPKPSVYRVSNEPSCQVTAN